MPDNRIGHSSGASRLRRCASAFALVGIGAIAAVTGAVPATTAHSAVRSIAVHKFDICNGFTCENHNQVLL